MLLQRTLTALRARPAGHADHPAVAGTPVFAAIVALAFLAAAVGMERS